MTPSLMCGCDTGHVLQLAYDANWDKDQPLWSWSPKGSNIELAHIGWFTGSRDVKYAHKGKRMLLCTERAIAVVTLKTGQIEFYAEVPGNLHSGDVLPDGNLVAVASDGNLVRVISTDPSVSPSPLSAYYKDYTLPNAHGIVWDRKRQCLWAFGGYGLGFCIIVRYKYNFNKKAPALAEVAERTFRVPKEGPHDLFPKADGTLFATTVHAVWTVDMGVTRKSRVSRLTSKELGVMLSRE